MAENVYLLKLADDAKLVQTVLQRLCLKDAPYYLRVATLAPISNFGYPETAEGSVLAWSDVGLTFGVPDDPNIPRSFIPAQNIAYIADGDLMKDWADFQAANPGSTWEAFIHSQAAV